MSDVWAFGVTMWEVFSNGAEPYAAMTNEEVRWLLPGGERRGGSAGACASAVNPAPRHQRAGGAARPCAAGAPPK